MVVIILLILTLFVKQFFIIFLKCGDILSNLELIKGIGNETIKKLNQLDIYNVDDLINYYPYRYEILKKSNLEDGYVVVKGIVESIPVINFFKGGNRLRFKALIDDKILNIIIFGRAFIKNNLIIGKEITIIGKYDKLKNTITASDIKLKDIGEKTLVTPIYHLVKGLSSLKINKYINEALKSNYVIDYLPEDIINKYHFLDKNSSLLEIHNPSEINKLNA